MVAGGVTRIHRGFSVLMVISLGPMGKQLLKNTARNGYTHSPPNRASIRTTPRPKWRVHSRPHFRRRPGTVGFTHLLPYKTRESLVRPFPKASFRISIHLQKHREVNHCYSPTRPVNLGTEGAANLLRLKSSYYIFTIHLGQLESLIYIYTIYHFYI